MTKKPLAHSQSLSWIRVLLVAVVGRLQNTFLIGAGADA